MSFEQELTNDFESMDIDGLFGADAYDLFDDNTLTTDDTSSTYTQSTNNDTFNLCDIEQFSQAALEHLASLATSQQQTQPSRGKTMNNLKRSHDNVYVSSSDEEDDEDEDAGDDEEYEQPSNKRRCTGSRRGRKPVQPLTLENGLVYEDGGIISYPIFSSIATSVKINKGSFFSNFTAQYANALFADGEVTINLFVPSFLETKSVTLQSPTMKEVLQALRAEYTRKLTKRELQQWKSKTKKSNSTEYKVYHTLKQRTIYDGLFSVESNVFNLRLRKQTDPVYNEQVALEEQMYADI